MLHSELKHSVGRRSHYLDGENVRPEGIGPSLLLPSEEAGQDCRIVDVDAVHRIVAISVTPLDSARGEETIVYRCGRSFCYGGMLRDISGTSSVVLSTSGLRLQYGSVGTRAMAMISTTARLQV